MKIKDIHTHHKAPQPEGVISIRFGKESEEIFCDQAYSTGIHPWDTEDEITETEWEEFKKEASRPEILAIGEAGLDLSGKGGPLFRQMTVFRRQIEISEELKKPLIIHNVKAHDMIAGLKRDLKPRQNWAIHGFRGKPETAAMLLKQGCFLSFGQYFNPATLAAMPQDRILAETDESESDIDQIILLLSDATGYDMESTIAENTKRFFNM